MVWHSAHDDEASGRGTAAKAAGVAFTHIMEAAKREERDLEVYDLEQRG